jgi:hypothetical protein
MQGFLAPLLRLLIRPLVRPLTAQAFCATGTG